MFKDENGEEYFKDDPIRLFDCEQHRVFCCAVENDIENCTDISNTLINELRADYEETLHSYKKNSSILPVTFFDIDRNVELLNKCRPLAIKLIDCGRFPWYHNRKTKLVNSNLNLIKNRLPEAVCLEILSTDENDDDDIVLKRTLENINPVTNGDKIYSKLRLLDENVTNHERHTINMHPNSKQELKTGKELSDLKDTQESIIIDTDSDEEATIIINKQHNETNAVEINTYARLIDKACKRLSYVKKYTILEDFEDSNECVLNRRSKHDCTTELKCGNNRNSVDNKKRAYGNIDKVGEFKSAGIIYNEEEVLVSKNVSKIKKEISEKKKKKEVLIEQTHRIDSEIENNIGSSSPLLPCPPKTKVNEKLISNTSFPAITKHKIKKSACNDQIFSANRVIPHYHYESKYALRTFNHYYLYQNISKKPTAKTGSIQSNESSGICHKTQVVTKECGQNQRIKLPGANVSESNNINHNNLCITKPNAIQNVGDNVCYSHLNINTEQSRNDLSRQSRNIGDNLTYQAILSIDATRGYESNTISAHNSLPIISERKPQQEYYNNIPTLQSQRPLGCNCHNNDSTSQSTGMSSVNHYISKNPYKNDTYSSKSYNTEHLSKMESDMIIPNINGSKPIPVSFYSIPLTAMDLISEYQTNKSDSLNKQQNSVTYNNNKDRICTDNGDIRIKAKIATIKEHNVNKKARKSIVKSDDFFRSDVIHNHPHLKHYLERPPLATNKTPIVGIDERLCSKIKANIISNKGYSPPILPIPTYQKTFEILAKTKLYDLDRGIIQSDLIDNNYISSVTFSGAEKNARKRKISDTGKISRNITTK